MTDAEDVIFDQACPVRDVLDRIGDQWSLLVLEALSHDTLRYSDLRRHIGDISKQMLAKTLRRLEMDGFVARQVFPEVPPRVEYSLTPLGCSFMGLVTQMITWADSNHRDIVLNRRKYNENDG